MLNNQIDIRILSDYTGKDITEVQFKKGDEYYGLSTKCYNKIQSILRIDICI